MHIKATKLSVRQEICHTPWIDGESKQLQKSFSLVYKRIFSYTLELIFRIVLDIEYYDFNYIFCEN